MTEHLYFYDAIAPIVSADSVNMEKAFLGARYLPENTDYLNCPFTEEEYHRFCEALLTGEKTPARDFEKEIHFEGCMPIEVMAERGRMTLAFGPFKPVGFVDPRTGERPFAIMQLRAEGYTYAEIAVQLHISESSARVIEHRTRSWLKEILTKEGYDL